MGQIKKYTPKAFREAVDKYFKSISKLEEIKELVPTKRHNAKGFPVLEYQPVLDDEGLPLMRRRFLVPPTLPGLCGYLKIVKSTLYEYAKDKRYSDTVTRAREAIDGFFQNEIISSDKPNGAIHMRENVYHFKPWNEDDDDSQSGDGGGVKVVFEGNESTGEIPLDLDALGG